jgi:hypothetical protein
VADGSNCRRPGRATTHSSSRCLDVLGRTLLGMQRRDENAVDLNEVIELQLEALAGFPPDAPYSALVVTTAAWALRDRFKVTGRIADLDLAIELLGDQAATPRSSALRPRSASACSAACCGNGSALAAAVFGNDRTAEHPTDP